MVIQELSCTKCKHYEAYHQFPNPNAVARHYCKKCQKKIYYSKPAGSDIYLKYIPKACYRYNFFEESEATKKEYEERYCSPPPEGCQIED